MKEVWKKSTDSKRRIYFVSNLGNVKSRDKNGVEKILKFGVDSCGYKTVSISGKNRTSRVHKLVSDIFLEKNGYDQIVDHINGDKLDNRASNLRFCSRESNYWNQNKRSKCSSKYKGVHYFKLKGGFYSEICKNKKRTYLGYFKDELEAARAYDTAAKELFGEYAKLNFNDKKN